jgi:thymidine phosphorylase
VWPASVRQGCVKAIDVRALGLALLRIGGGRSRPGDQIDPCVGLTEVLGVGEAFSPQRPLAVVHAASKGAVEQAAAEVAAAFEWAETGVEVAAPPLVHELLEPAA